MGYKYRHDDTTPDHVNSKDSNEVPTPKIAPRDATATNIVQDNMDYNKKKQNFDNLVNKAAKDSTTNAHDPDLISYGLKNMRTRSEDNRDDAEVIKNKAKSKLPPK